MSGGVDIGACDLCAKVIKNDIDFMSQSCFTPDVRNEEHRLDSDTLRKYFLKNNPKHWVLNWNDPAFSQIKE